MKVNSINELIKYIRQNILSNDYNDLQITIYNDCVTFAIYDMFNIVIEISNDKIYDENLIEFQNQYMVKFKTEFTKEDMTITEIQEVGKICEFLNENIDIVTDLLKE